MINARAMPAPHLPPRVPPQVKSLRRDYAGALSY